MPKRSSSAADWPGRRRPSPWPAPASGRDLYEASADGGRRRRGLADPGEQRHGCAHHARASPTRSPRAGFATPRMVLRTGSETELRRASPPASDGPTACRPDDPPGRPVPGAARRGGPRGRADRLRQAADRRSSHARRRRARLVLRRRDATGDLLVGADGLRSRTRTLIDPAAPPARYTGLLNVGGYARGARPGTTAGRHRLLLRPPVLPRVRRQPRRRRLVVHQPAEPASRTAAGLGRLEPDWRDAARGSCSATTTCRCAALLDASGRGLRRLADLRHPDRAHLAPRRDGPRRRRRPRRLARLRPGRLDGVRGRASPWRGACGTVPRRRRRSPPTSGCAGARVEEVVDAGQARGRRQGPGPGRPVGARPGGHAALAAHLRARRRRPGRMADRAPHRLGQPVPA